ncbi:hypothetical protein WA026_007705 [Henosepilachna vigintioctopunctata]|uniref:Uncharacterized protein n=1 Tax=Henosepilachna vigintioctopunctata TaxID=420089 RepID=A0AAW1U7N9_9CUCU
MFQRYFNFGQQLEKTSLLIFLILEYKKVKFSRFTSCLKVSLDTLLIWLRRISKLPILALFGSSSGIGDPDGTGDTEVIADSEGRSDSDVTGDTEGTDGSDGIGDSDETGD